MKMRKQIQAVWLLSVILQVIFVAPFHHHDHDAAEDLHCEACAHHQPHAGHLTAQGATDDCLVCQLLGQFYVPADAPAFRSQSVALRSIASPVLGKVVLHPFQPSAPRAPPVSFCS